jgi:hypothetical protein
MGLLRGRGDHPNRQVYRDRFTNSNWSGYDAGGLPTMTAGQQARLGGLPGDRPSNFQTPMEIVRAKAFGGSSQSDDLPADTPSTPSPLPSDTTTGEYLKGLPE